VEMGFRAVRSDLLSDMKKLKAADQIRPQDYANKKGDDRGIDETKIDVPENVEGRPVNMERIQQVVQHSYYSPVLFSRQTFDDFFHLHPARTFNQDRVLITDCFSEDRNRFVEAIEYFHPVFRHSLSDRFPSDQPRELSNREQVVKTEFADQMS